MLIAKRQRQSREKNYGTGSGRPDEGGAKKAEEKFAALCALPYGRVRGGAAGARYFRDAWLPGDAAEAAGDSEDQPGTGKAEQGKSGIAAEHAGFEERSGDDSEDRARRVWPGAAE